jgi:hypothetical protein
MRELLTGFFERRIQIAARNARTLLRKGYISIIRWNHATSRTLIRYNYQETIRAAHIPCYTGYVGKPKQNVTLVVDEDLLLAARKVALDRGTSVNQLVREFLAGLVEQTDRRRLARERLMKMMETGIVEVGDITWSRDDLYER